MRPLVHLFAIVAGIAAPIGVERLTMSAHGPRSKASYEAVERASMGPREVVRAYLDLAVARHQPQQALAEYLSPRFVGHDASAAAGANPAGKGAVRHIAVDGDVVMVEYDGPAARPAAVDIFRVAAGKIVEHWSVAGAPAERQS